MTRGKAILGVGTGEREGNEPYGVDWSTPVARFEEAVATIRALWNSGGELVSRESPFFPLHNAVFDLPPYKGKWPEMWIAAHGPRMLRIAGRYADAWLPMTVFDPKAYTAKLNLMRDAASDSGRDPASIIPAIGRYVVTGRSRDEIDEALASDVMKVGALNAPADVWARHGMRHPLGDDFSGAQDLVPQVLDEKTALAYVRDVPLSLLKECSLAGTPDDVVEQVAEWRDHGVRYAVLTNVSALQPDLRKGLGANVPFAKILRGTRRL
jgi:phthiodiolone/phenolphthiodiolone dimycocerosates ketoreductase